MRRNSSNEAATKNIETVIRLEEEDEKRISLTDRTSEIIGSFAGTIQFVLPIPPIAIERKQGFRWPLHEQLF
jgi:uncharacterized membrane protein